MNRQRILSLALILILALASTGYAESAYGSLTLNNFHLELADAKPVDVKVSIKVGYGGQLPDGPARLDFLVTGGDKTAFSGMASLQDGMLQAVLEKSKYRFQIPVEGLTEELFTQTPYSMMSSLWYVLPPEVYYGLSDAMYYSWQGKSEAMPKLEDFQRAWDLAERYAAYYQDSLDPARSMEQDRKLFEILKPEFKGKEAIDLFGKLTNLNRYEITFSGDGLKTYYQAVYQADPEFKALEEEAAKLMKDFGFDGDKAEEKGEAEEADESSDGAEKAEDPKDAEDAEEDPLEQLIEESTFEKIAFVIWSDTEVIGDASSKAQKTLMTMTMKDAVDEYGMPVVLEIPLTSEYQLLKQGTRVGYAFAYAPYKGESAKATFHAMLDTPGQDGGTVTDVKASLDVNSEENGIVLNAVLTGKETVDKTGVDDTSLTVKGTANGKDFKLGYEYDGKTSTKVTKSGTVTLLYDFPAFSGLDGVNTGSTIRFDSRVESGPYQVADYTPYKDLQPVNPMRASYKAMEAVSGDMNGAMMQGVGVLMQTRGLSSLMGGLMKGLIPQ